jgi:heat shock protein HtpX
MNFEDVLVQVFQPYFYYSVIFLTISFVCIKVITKCCPFIGSRTKSLIYLIPISGPLFITLTSPPKMAIQAVSYHLIGSFTSFTPQAPIAFSPFQLIQPPLQQSIVTLVAFSTNQILSITGIICLMGLAVGGIYAVTTLALGDWIASRILNVINLAPNEYEWLQAEIAKVAKKLSIATPQVALVEDLRPNAFTMGFGRKTKIVFTIGLLNVLDKEEIFAVASHELAHIKSHDFFFKTISNALTAVSFFNPLAYFSFFNAQREREMLADENGAKLLQKPDSLAKALTKITAALKNLPKEGRFIRLTSNLLVTSPIIHRPQILSAHPKIDLRLRNISQLNAPKPKHLKTNKLIAAVILTCVIVIAGATVTCAMVSLQTGYTTTKMALTIPTGFKVVSTDATSNHIILIESNLTYSPMPNRIATMEHLSPQVFPAPAPVVQDAPGFYQNQPQYMTARLATPLYLIDQPNPAIIYAFTNETGTFLIIKN